MSEHPPIPDELRDELRTAAYQDSLLDSLTNRQIDAMIRVAAPILWREWTRGMAVVPLPEPSEDHGVLGVLFHECWAHTQFDEPKVLVHGKVLDPDEARDKAGRILAAADRAEQLAAEAEGATT